MSDPTFQRALKLKEHYIAIGQTEIWLRDDSLPLDAITAIEPGGQWRLSGPTGVYLIAKIAGLTFRSSFEFESRDASGTETHLFDREKIRDLMWRLKPEMRKRFAVVLRDEVFPAVAKRAKEYREMLNKQNEASDFIRGVILGAGLTAGDLKQ